MVGQRGLKLPEACSNTMLVSTQSMRATRPIAYNIQTPKPPPLSPHPSNIVFPTRNVITDFTK